MPSEASFETNDELEDLNKFTKLCSELECALSSAYGSLDEVLELKDILLEQNIPCNVKVKLTLALGRLHRSMSDLGVPTGEITRLVKLYAVPWENKSKALKKLHQDYESKQHQLEIALKRLEMVGIQSIRMERERIVQNWEKLFAKMVGSKGHGQRWRFLIHQFKMKIEKGENLADMYSISSDDENDEDERINEKRKEIMPDNFNDRLKRIEKFQENITYNDQTAETKKLEEIGQAHSVIEEESEASLVYTISDNISVVSNDQESLSASTSQVQKKVRFDESGSVGYENDKRDSLILNQSNILPAKTVETADKEIWTHEPETEKMFHIRVYETICKTITAPWCTIAFDQQVRKSAVFKSDIDSETEVSNDKSAEKSNGNSNSVVADGRKDKDKSSQNAKQESEQNFQEFIFKLSPDFDLRNHNEIFLKVSVHPENKKTMIAMMSIKLSELKLVEDPRGIASKSEKSSLSPCIYQIKSAVNNSKLTFNKPCGEVHLLCFYSKVLLPKVVSRATETLSIEEITDKIIAMRKKEFAQRLKSASTTMTEKLVYTEEQMKRAKEELKKELLKLREEYEERLNLMISELNNENSEDVREFINAATSPLHMQSTDIDDHEIKPQIDQPVDIPKPPRSHPSKSPKRVSRQKTEPVWGENLPTDFYERMDMFQEASQKHHQELKEKYNEKTFRETEKQLASQNRLDRVDNHDEKLPKDICLPALFMPQKGKNIYSSRARSYFHALGTQDYRITQPPSILQLPRLKAAENSSELLGLYQSIRDEKAALIDLAGISKGQSDTMSLASTVIDVCDTDKINSENDLI